VEKYCEGKVKDQQVAAIIAKQVMIHCFLFPLAQMSKGASHGGMHLLCCEPIRESEESFPGTGLPADDGLSLSGA
jgi:hypothetical protein